MRSLTRHIRILALVQLLLALPLMGSSSVCISLDGSGHAESGLCACILSPVTGVEESIGPAGSADCGPCRDVALGSLRSPTRMADLAPAMICHSDLPALVAPIAAMPVAHRVGFGEPPGSRLRILRC